MRKLLASCLLLSFGAQAQTTAFVNVNVLSMTGEAVLAARTVIVTGGRIETVGAVAATEVPEEAEVVDGTDRYLLPGLAEMHAHVTDTAERQVERLFALYLANGVTTIRGMLGRPEHLMLRDALARDEILGPRLITSGPSFNGNSVDSPAGAARMVREQQAAGYDFLKIHPGLSRAEFDAIVETAAAVDIPVAGHVPADVGVAGALAAQMATIDHLDGYMETLMPADRDPTGGVGGFFGVMLAAVAEADRIAEIALKTADAGVWNVPTQSLFEHFVNAVPPEELADRPEMKYVPRDTLEGWIRDKRELISGANFDPETARRAIELRRRLIAALHDSGAGLLLGSDSPQRFNVPGFSLHRELKYLVDAGLTPYQALQTGTVNPALFLGAAGERGTIEVGKLADLVLLDENPFDDIRHSRRVHGTMVRGHWISRPELDRMLERAETP